MYLKYFVIILLITITGGCGSDDPRSESPNVKMECAPLETIQLKSLPVLPEDAFENDPILNKYFSIQALHTANYLGLIPELKSMVAAPEKEREDKIQDLEYKVSTVFMKISVTAAELDCEEERADQIADYLLDISSTRNWMLTLYSIILAAIGTIIVSLMDLVFNTKKTIYRSVQIVFGITVAIIGVSILTTQEIQISFNHERNLLGEIGNDDTNSHFHPEVWNFLTKPEAREKGKPPLREVLIGRWKTTGELGAKSDDEKNKLLKLLFGKGGLYSASELRIRANYFDQLESTVNLMKSDVLNLQEQLYRYGICIRPISKWILDSNSYSLSA